MDIFKQVLNHAEFKKNPTGTMQTHLTNKIYMEKMDT